MTTAVTFDGGHYKNPTMKRLFLTIITIITAIGLNARIKNVAPQDSKVVRYELAAFEVTLTGNWNNPYLQEEAALDMILISPSGRELTLPCFYKSGKSGEESLWEARFTPQEKGQYSYRFVYREGGKEVSATDIAVMNVKEGKGRGILHIRDNWTLQYDNGDIYRGVAMNLCWESRTNDDSKYFSDLHEQHDRFNYDVMLPMFAENGGNFTRMWMCSWNFPIDQQDRFNNHRYTATDEYMNPSATERLDHVIRLAEKNDIKIMLCMGQGNVRADHDFFISDKAKARYRNRLRYIVARWGYSTAVGMWEFFNEIDNIQHRGRNGVIPSKDIVAWHDEMSTYLKEIDPFDHITTTSISHRDLEGLNSVRNLDINQKHIYNATVTIPRNIRSYSKQFGKPYVIGEFGYEWDWSKNFDDFADGMDMDFRRGLWYGLFSATPVTPMSWWWEYFENRNMIPYIRNVRYINDKMLKAGDGSFEIIEAGKEGKAETFAVRCGEKIFVYLYNGSENVFDNTEIRIGRTDKVRISRLDTDKVRLKKVCKAECDEILKIEHLGIKPLEEAIFVVE